MSRLSSPRATRLATGLCFLGPLLLYVCTASRTAQGGDTTEFALIGSLGGVSHPPGYPLYSLLARLGAWWPWGTPFFRVALVSAVCGAAAVAVLQRVAWRLTGSLGASVVAALAFSVCREQWRLAGVPEVFTLHVLAAGLVLLGALRIVEATPPERPRWALLLGLTFGLGLANHLTLVFCAPVLLWAFIRAARGARWSQGALLLALCSGGVLVGLLPYLELVWAARTAGPAAPLWGDTASWGGFVRHVLREEYGTFRLSLGEQPDPVRHVLAYLRSLPVDVGYVWLVPAAVGMVQSWRRRRGFSAALLSMWLLSGIIFITRFNLPDNPTGHETETRFYLLPHFLLFPFVASGLVAIGDRLRPRLAILVAGTALSIPLVLNFQAADWRRDSALEQTLRAVLDGMAPKGVLVGRGDVLLSGMSWVQNVLGFRQDVRYIDVNLLAAPWYFERVRRGCPECGLRYSGRSPPLPELVASLASRVPTYITHTLAGLPPQAPVRLEPAGLVDRVVPPETPPISLDEARARLERATALFGPQPPPVDAWSATMHTALGQAWVSLAGGYQQVGQAEAAQLCLDHADDYLQRE